MMKPVGILVATVVVFVAVVGCGIEATPREEPLPAAEDDALMTEWRALAAVDYEDLNHARITEIANAMARRGKEGLEPFFGVLEDPDMTPMAKMVAVMSLAPHVKQNDAPRLIALTDEAYDEVTRGCATHLLSQANAPEAMFRVRELMDDENRHVSKVATLIMLRTGAAEPLEKALALLEDPETLARDRSEILLTIPDAAALAHLQVYAEAICDDELALPARQRAIHFLEVAAGADLLPAVEACLEREDNPEVSSMLEQARAEIQRRDDEGITVTPMPAPAGMDIEFRAIPPEEANRE